MNSPGCKLNVLTGSHARSAQCLAFEIGALAREFGIEKLGFLTLTFADHVTDIRESSRRFNSLNTGVLKERYLRSICTVERQKSGRVHFHLVVVLRADIRTGFDFSGIERGDYSSAGRAIRSEWSFWRETARLYGFGRTELLPIRSCSEGIARYVGKYISKHIGARVEEDKGARLVRYVGYVTTTKEGERASLRKGSPRFGWNTDRGRLWRRTVGLLARECGCEDIADFSAKFGPRWAYAFAPIIIAMTEESGKRSKLEVTKS